MLHNGHTHHGNPNPLGGPLLGDEEVVALPTIPLVAPAPECARRAGVQMMEICPKWQSRLICACLFLPSFLYYASPSLPIWEQKSFRSQGNVPFPLYTAVFTPTEFADNRWGFMTEMHITAETLSGSPPISEASNISAAMLFRMSLRKGCSQHTIEGLGKYDWVMLDEEVPKEQRVDLLQGYTGLEFQCDEGEDLADCIPKALWSSALGIGTTGNAQYGFQPVETDEALSMFSVAFGGDCIAEDEAISLQLDIYFIPDIAEPDEIEYTNQTDEEYAFLVTQNEIIYNENFNHAVEELSTLLTGRLAIHVTISTENWFEFEYTLRVIGFVLCFFHWTRYRKALRTAIDDVRPEQTIFGWSSIAMMIELNPFYFITAFPAEWFVGKPALRFICEVLLKKCEPAASTVYTAGAYCVTVVIVSTTFRERTQERRKVYTYFFVLVFVGLALEVVTMSVSGWLVVPEENDFNLETQREVNMLAVVQYTHMAVYVIIVARFALAVFGGTVFMLFLCGRCGMTHTLRRLPYFATRDRQLSCKMLQLLLLLTCLDDVMNAIHTPEESEERGRGLFSAVFGIFTQFTLLFASTPVFCTTDTTESKPPSPCDLRWKQTVWAPRWFEWINTTPSALTLYPFLTVEEEERFWALNDHLIDNARPVFFMNYEKALWAVFAASESYKLDCSSAAVSAVTAALVSIAASMKKCQFETNLNSLLGGPVDVRPQCDLGGPHAHSGWLEEVESEEDSEELRKPSLAERIFGQLKEGRRLLPELNARRPKVAMTLEVPNYTVLRVLLLSEVQVVFSRILLGAGRRALMIAFRGSSNKKNWAADLQVAREPYSPMTDTTAATNCCDTSVPCVHSGFSQLWKDVSGEVISTLQTLAQGCVVMVTGHSLGAAMATLCGYSLVQEGWDVEVYTFGCPMVGNRVFQGEYDRVVRRYFRFVNENDIFTQAAFTAHNRHLGRKVLLSSRNGMLSVDPPWFETFSSPRNYLWGRALSHGIHHYRKALAEAFLSHGQPHGPNLPPLSELRRE